MTLMNWDRPPYNRWSFQHVREIVPTMPIGACIPMPLPEAEERIDLSSLAVKDRDGRTTTARAILASSFTDGILVLHKGKIALEEYSNGMRPATLHLTQSVSKSVVAALVGILNGMGEFPLRKTVSEYVPDFEESAYRDVTMEHLLNMTSGVHFPEDMADPRTGIGLMDIAVGWKPAGPESLNPRTVHALIASLRKTVRPHGSQFEYRSIETEVLGCCIEAAMQQCLCDLVSEFIWQPMGAEYEANFGVDPAGFAIADGGLSASLRDLGRFGLIYAQDGYANGRQIVPASWVAETRRGDSSMFTAAQKVDRPNGAYRNKFWIDDVSGSAILALGIYGQMIYIDDARDFVGVKLSSWPEALNPSMRLEMVNLMSAMANVLSPA